MPAAAKHATPTVETITERIRPILPAHDIEKAIVFGSVARGTADRRSDVDLLIVKNTNVRFLDRSEEFSDLYSALAQWGLELLVYTPEELARNSDRAFVRTILAEGITIYERGKTSN